MTSHNSRFAHAMVRRPDPGGLALAALLLTASLGACGRDDARAARSQPAVPVTVAKITRQTVPVTVRAIGHVEPIATVAVKARIGGTLDKVHFREGQDVRAGDLLFTIDPRPSAAALRQAEAQLERDQALARKAEADVARYKELVAKDFVTKEQYDQIVANAGALRASAQADQANLDNARLQLAYCTITAPIAGRTGNLSVKPGNLIKANDDRGLVTINQTRPIDVSFTVPAQLLPAISQHDGQRLKVTAVLPEQKQPELGQLTFVDNGVDPATSTILLRATFANGSERLWAGQFVDVTLVLDEEADRIVAPATAVQTGQQGSYVFVVKADETVDLRAIKVARQDETQAVVDSGLQPGETVVTDGQLRLVPGAKVTVATGEQRSGGAAR